MFWGKHDPRIETESGIHIENVRCEMPAFKRIYSKRLDNRASIKIEMQVWSLGLRQSGELAQPNGRHIYFDPRAIADKIIDPLLVPLVEAAVNEIHEIDRAYRKSVPSEFIDERGVKWRRTDE